MYGGLHLSIQYIACRWRDTSLNTLAYCSGIHVFYSRLSYWKDASKCSGLLTVVSEGYFSQYVRILYRNDTALNVLDYCRRDASLMSLDYCIGEMLISVHETICTVVLPDYACYLSSGILECWMSDGIAQLPDLWSVKDV